MFQSSAPPAGFINVPLVAALAGKVLSGCRLSNGSDATNDIDIAAGYCVADDGSAIIEVPDLTKRLDATFTAGTNQGGRVGSLANGTWFVIAIAPEGGGAGDIILSDSLSPTLPGGYDIMCVIGAVPRVSASLIGFSQHGSEFLITPTNFANVANLGTSATLYALGVVPTGVKVRAIISGYGGRATNGTGLVTSPDQPDTAPSATAADFVSVSGIGNLDHVGSGFQKVIRTDTSGQIRARSSGSSTTFVANVEGWHWDGLT